MPAVFAKISLTFDKLTECTTTAWKAGTPIPTDATRLAGCHRGNQPRWSGIAGSKAATRWRTCPSRIPVPIGAEGLHGGSDLRRSDDANRQPPPNVDRYKTMAFDTMARPVLWPVPGVAADYDNPKKSKRRFLGLGLVVLGVFAMVGGLYLIQTPTWPTHQFVPSTAELDVLRTGGTGTPSDCSSQIANSVSNKGYGAEINPREANTEITVYPNSLVLIDGNSPEISANAPLCNLASSTVGGGSTEVTYVAERPGDATIYFIDSDAHVSVAKIVVTASTPPSSLPGWALLAVGALASACGAVLMIRRKAWRSDR